MILDEVTGVYRDAKEEAKGRFDHMVVDKNVNISFGKVVYAGQAYHIGSRRSCLEWQLKSGLRASTEVIPF